MYGILILTAGIASMLQYALFDWAEASGFAQVSVILRSPVFYFIVAETTACFHTMFYIAYTLVITLLSTSLFFIAKASIIVFWNAMEVSHRQSAT